MKTYKTLALAMLCGCGAIGLQAQTPANPALYRQFLTPPQSAQIRVWWHWMNGNITKDGLKKDLLWMKRAHIGGFQAFDAGLATPQIVQKRLEYMTPEWKDAFRFATNIADSLDLEMAIASSPGWSATGGPWVEPKDAMKKVVWRETRLAADGKKTLEIELPEPYRTTGTFQNIGAAADMSMMAGKKEVKQYYEDIAVVAVRLPDADKTLEQLGAKVSASGGTFSVADLTDGDLAKGSLLPSDPDKGYAWIQYEFPVAQTIKALSFVDQDNIRAQWQQESPLYIHTLLASDDGVNFREVCKIPNGSVARQTITIPETTARYFRLHIANPKVNNPYGDIGAAFGAKAPEPPKGSNISEWVLYPVVRINHAEEKAAYASPWDLESFPTPAGVQAEFAGTHDVVVLTDRVKEGKLSWKAPKGNWLIYRFGYSLTGKENHPASPEATGLEVDKMDPVAWKKFFTYYFDMYKDAAGGKLGKRGIQYILTDSYEAGAENWTPALADEFKARRSYDLIPWLPVLTGQIIGSATESEQFLWDFRKTFSELIAEGYDHLTKIAQEDYGMLGRYSEAHENGRLYTVDGMDVKRTAQVPMSAIWMPGTGGGSALNMSKADIRESASVAHIYGQNLAAAESMTAVGFGGFAWSYHPGNLKGIADVELANGLNRFVIHESAHQPLDDKQPGLGLMIFGQWFNRHETWAENANVWADYLSRSSFLLQQGKFAADIVYYYGEDNNITGLFGNELPAMPAGYNYDFINPDALIRLLDVKDGKLVTPSGMSYRVLALDKNVKRMSMPVLRKLAQLANQGAVICGAVPEMVASRTDSRAEFDKLVADIWYSGKKNVYAHRSIESVLQMIKVAPDFTQDSSREVNYVHRTLPQAEIYWVNKPDGDFAAIRASFRVTGKKPQVWHPETGKVEEVSYKIGTDRTEVTLHLVPNDAVFVIFEGTPQQNEVRLTRASSEILTIAGPWEVTFQEKRGAPEKATFDRLVSFTESDHAGIKYFSGTATYTNTVKLNKKQLAEAGRVQLCLGDVKNLAKVFVNDQELGVVWKAPYVVDVTDALKVGENTLKIEVTNAWVNRLIGDAQPGVKEKLTYTSLPFYQANSPLLPSGLLGPVKLVSVK